MYYSIYCFFFFFFFFNDTATTEIYTLSLHDALPIGSVTAVPRPAADRAASYGLAPLVVDGNDPEAVHGVAIRTIARARAGEGPSLVEAVTYRHGGHSRADPGKYRPEEEVREWLARD